MRILKFGGSSVADAGRIKGILDIVKQSRLLHPEIALVVSAMGGVTDRLVKLCETIPTDHAGSEAIVLEIEHRHLTALKALLPAAHQSGALAEVMSVCNELSSVVKGASLVGEVTPRTRDLILSFGERLSAYIVAQTLKLELPEARYTDARLLIRTDNDFGHAKVDFETTNQAIRVYFGLGKQHINVITGFIATSPQGQTTTLGRSGSDYTAAIFGAALQADAIEIWTDVDGVMTADPRFVAEARTIGQLSYIEAMELSHFGAKVIFPATMQPAMAVQVPILVKNTFNPSHEGTLICKETGPNSGYIKGISSLKSTSLINIEGSGMIGVAGVSARIFKTLSQHKINVILISQASSEHSVCLGIMQDDSEKAVKLLREAFAEELSAGILSSIVAENGLAIVAVVGENMRKTPGVASKVFAPLGRNGINVKAVAQGSSELNISIVIEESDLKKTLRALHQSLFKSEMLSLHLYIAGTGAIGAKLLEMIQTQKEYLASKKIELKVCGLCNTRKMLLREDGIKLEAWDKTMQEEGWNADLKAFVSGLTAQNRENSVFIDLTASDGPMGFYPTLLSKNIAVVAANKRANTQSMEHYDRLREAVKTHNTPFHYETNVGAGLPVIGVLQGLMASGDVLVKIEAVLSGTMNYLLSEYDGSRTFTEMVRFAKENGYAEPDPRDDLSGTDVARKCLIAARECGWALELGDISVEPLMHQAAVDTQGVPAFFEELKNYDAVFHKRFEEAKAKGKRLRYAATIEGGKAAVSVVEVDDQHPFYGLKGTENCISINSRYYSKYPMVVKGPGAGVDVTSAGVMADIYRIAEGLRR